MTRPQPPLESDLDTDLRREFEHHLELLRRDELCRGAEESLAARRAMERFGDPDRHAAACRRVVLGGLNMKRALFIAWNLVLALGVGLSLMFATVAWLRSMDNASRMGVDKTAMLRAIWSSPEGTVEVKGNVARPGTFRTSVSRPLSVAQLVEMAGGAAQDSQGLVLWKFADSTAEGAISLADAIRNQDDFNTMPAPGSVLTVK